MQKLSFILLLFYLSGCVAAEQKALLTPITVPVKSSTTTVKSRPQATTPVNNSGIVYDSKVESYIKQHGFVKKLKNVAPEFAYKKLSSLCTVEKFVAGINATDIEISKLSSDTIEIKTFGNKMGTGIIKIRKFGKQANLTKVEIGKLRKTSPTVLRQFAHNLCTHVDEKLK